MSNPHPAQRTLPAPCEGVESQLLVASSLDRSPFHTFFTSGHPPKYILSFLLLLYFLWSLLMGVYVPRRTLLSAWGVGSRTRFWWFRLTWLILGIYNLQGLDVAGLLSGPQPSSSTLPNLSSQLSCRFWQLLLLDLYVSSLGKCHALLRNLCEKPAQ